jgi:AhpC/TSA family
MRNLLRLRLTRLGIQHNSRKNCGMISFLLHVTLCLAFLTSQVSVGVAAEAKKEKAPEFVLTTFDKKSISLSDFRGRAVVLKFIASW